jgi:hypothetical protein
MLCIPSRADKGSDFCLKILKADSEREGPLLLFAVTKSITVPSLLLAAHQPAPNVVPRGIMPQN